jgi:hypothetical protein
MSDEYALPVDNGWVAPEEGVVEAFKETLQYPEFSDVPIYGAEEAPDTVLLFKSVEKVTGKPLPALNQGAVGSCCGFGWTNAAQVTAAVEIDNGDRETWKLLSPSYVYGGSRVLIGGSGRPPFRGDGSNAVWCAKFSQQYGIVSAEEAGVYTEAQARKWGSEGPPKSLLESGKKHLIKTVTQVKTIDQLVAAISAGYAIQIASNAGFTQTRDKEGFCRRSGVWNHSMAMIAYKDRKGKRPGVLVVNSWGPNSASGPMVDMPNGACFWISFDDANYILRQGDSWAYSGIDGFKQNKLDYSGLNY